MKTKKGHPNLKKYASFPRPEQTLADLERRRSSAASPHTPKPRKGTKGERNRNAIKNNQNEWGL